MKKIVFLTYESRSGSTLLAQKLISSFNCTIAPEAQLPINLMLRFKSNHLLSPNDISTILEMINADKKIDDWGITEKIKTSAKAYVGKSIDLFIKHIYELFLEDNRQDIDTFLIVKKESYTLFSDRIKVLYPLAKFIYIVRDPRGVFASKKNSIYTFTGKPFDVCAVSSSISWVWHLKFIKNLCFCHPNDVLIVRYEDLIQDDKHLVQSISQFFYLNVEKNDRKIILNKRYNKLHQNIFGALIKDNHKKWFHTLSQKEIFFVQNICYNYLSKFNYISISIDSYHKFYWTLQLYIMFNFHMFKLKIKHKFRSMVYSNNGYIKSN